MSDTWENNYVALASHFKKFFNLIQAADRNLQLAKYGIKQLEQLDENYLPAELYPVIHAVTAGLSIDSQISASYPKQRFRSEISEEINKEFASLHASTAVAYWTALESLVRDFSAFWVINYKSKLKIKKLSREILISIEDIIRFDEDKESVGWSVCNDIIQKSNCKNAINKFEFLFSELGLAHPQIDKKEIIKLVELEAVRHIVVHKSSTVDKSFKARCPSFKDVPEKIGDVFQINNNRIAQYGVAVRNYASLIVDRVKLAAPESVNP